MTSTSEPSKRNQIPKRNSRARRILIFSLVVLLLVVVSIGLTDHTDWLMGLIPAALRTSLPSIPLGNPASKTMITPEEIALLTTQILSPQISETRSPSITTTYPTPPAALSTPSMAPDNLLSNISTMPALNLGIIILSINDGAYTHLFAYQAQSLPFTRLTNGGWDDITPSISPDGTRVAFASNRSGYMDLYILDLTNAEITRITSTPEYDAAPSWSPDGRWLVYESYFQDVGAVDGNLEVFIRDVSITDPVSQVPIRLTQRPEADFSPAWSPSGRLIAFVSQSGDEQDIWLADLDHIGSGFLNLSRSNELPDIHPAWSPDGSYLAWASPEDGVMVINIWDAAHQNLPPRRIGSGNWPTWNSTGSALGTSIQTPNQTYLTGYSFPDGGLVLPPITLPEPFMGLSWSSGKDIPIFGVTFNQIAKVTPTPHWQVALSPIADQPGGRQRVVPVSDLSAPYAFLHDQVEEAFQALRTDVMKKTGWDALYNLENAFVPLTMPLFPGMRDDWLYTGRAFALNTTAINAGWMVAVREDFGSSTFWRIFLRTRFQDGSQGTPLHDLPWDLYARSSGDPRSYEQGGNMATLAPSGYWIDFTSLAARYGWERLPALSSWRIAYQAARFNEFVITGELDWFTAMLEVYPPEALAIVTAMPPLTNTPTNTPIPTYTPIPTLSSTPTRTPVVTATPTAPPG